MIPVSQQFKHDPESGTFDDSMRAVLASIFELPIDHVPHFFGEGRDGKEARKMIDGFLYIYGLRLVSIPFLNYEQEGYQPILDQMQSWSPDVMYLLVGANERGANHVVLACGNEIIHDPEVDGSGLVRPSLDGHYWIEFMADSRTVKR
jgi:hypothetical protein